ncbi:MAG: Rdx family protein [Actinobacteria bacterium]|nr:Rdx family protein [Actinomycetota bacterium]
MTDEILSGWAPLIESFELVPASGGRFELTLDDELVFSKKAEGRHAEPGEIVALVRDALGPEVMPEE